MGTQKGEGKIEKGGREGKREGEGKKKGKGRGKGDDTDVYPPADNAGYVPG